MPENSYGETHKHEVVRVHEAITSRGIPSFIEDVEFVDCEIYGPAIIAALGDVTIDNCDFDAPPEVLFIEAEPNRPYIGVIALKNVRFFECRFHNIGIIAPHETIEQFKQSLPSQAPPPA